GGAVEVAQRAERKHFIRGQRIGPELDGTPRLNRSETRIRIVVVADRGIDVAALAADVGEPGDEIGAEAALELSGPLPNVVVLEARAVAVGCLDVAEHQQRRGSLGSGAGKWVVDGGFGVLPIVLDDVRSGERRLQVENLKIIELVGIVEPAGAAA